MDATVAALLFGCLVVAVVGSLLWRSQRGSGKAEASFSFGELFSATVKLEPQNAKSAEDAVQRAAEERGDEVRPLSGNLPIATARLARVLWVDDKPDNNVYETVALEQLGKFVTKATST